MHNVHHMLALMKRIRTAILEDCYPDFVKGFFEKYFDGKDVPEWAQESLKGVGIDL